MMPSWYTPLFWFIGIFAQLCYVSMVELLLKPRFTFRFHRLIPAAVLSLLTSTISLALPINLRILFCSVMYLIVPLALYQGRLAMKLLAFALWMVIYPCAEAVGLIVAPLFGWIPTDVSPWSQFGFDLICTIVISILFLGLRGLLGIIENRLSRQLWVRLTAMGLSMVLLSLIIAFNLLCQQGYITAGWIIRHLYAINALAMFLPPITILTAFSLIHELNNSIRDSEQARFMEAQARAELRRSQDIISKNQQYQQLRHDIKNHLLAIDALGVKGEYEHQHQYLLSLNAAFEQTREHVYCGHTLIDSILEAKALRMQQADIQCSWKLHPAPEKIHMNDLDLCALIGNIMDNAINACEQLSPGIRRWMEFSLQATQSELLLRAANACPNAQEHLRFMEQRRNKPSGVHGIGLRSMRRIVDSCNGELLLSCGEDNASIVISVYLPLPGC